MKRPNKDPSKRTKVYHITYSREYGVGCLYFWGCNLRCRLCLLKKEAFDCHLPETRFRIYDPTYRSDRPRRFLTLKKLLLLLDPLELKQVILMGAEPVCDPSLPQIVTSLKQSKGSSIVLLTNGKKMSPLSLLDQVIFSIKAITPSLHRDYTGCDNEAILRNFITIASCKSVSLHTETVFIPSYVDEDEVLRIANFIASVDRTIPFRIDAYLPIQGLPWHAPNVEAIHSLTEKVRRILPNASCLYGDDGKTDLAYMMERIF
ncbi:MAG: radical SAM protein [Deltaproteobacteria bacterium]|nr:radical SAM protein [Deltaproteobacteria bacterium]